MTGLQVEQLLCCDPSLTERHESPGVPFRAGSNRTREDGGVSNLDGAGLCRTWKGAGGSSTSGAVVRAAEAARIDAPINRTLFALLTLLDPWHSRR